MAILSQLVKPEIYLNLPKQEQARVEDWITGEMLYALPSSITERILSTDRIQNILIDKAANCLFANEEPPSASGTAPEIFPPKS